MMRTKGEMLAELKGGISAMVGMKDGQKTSARTVKVCVKNCVKRDEVGDVQCVAHERGTTLQSLMKQSC